MFIKALKIAFEKIRLFGLSEDEKISYRIQNFKVKERDAKAASESGQLKIQSKYPIFSLK